MNANIPNISVVIEDMVISLRERLRLMIINVAASTKLSKIKCNDKNSMRGKALQSSIDVNDSLNGNIYSSISLSVDFSHEILSVPSFE